MTLEKAESAIKARIWQAIAQGSVDLNTVPRESLEGLVNLVTEAALLELDADLSTTIKESGVAPAEVGNPFDDVEDILWQGRPFMSITTTYTITDERIRVTDGLLGKSHTDIELVRVQSMSQKQTFGERLMKLGDLTIRSHDPKTPIIILRNIPEPEDVHEILRRAVLKARNKHGLTYREEM